jgi:hypothetical protein
VTSTVSAPRRRQRDERLADERRLAVAARRDQEDLLAGAEVGDQPIELASRSANASRGTTSP